jgi:hypothetical protein
MEFPVYDTIDATVPLAMLKALGLTKLKTRFLVQTIK